MKKIIIFLTVLVLLFSVSLPASAADNVIYEKDAGEVIFEYGSEHSETDLFSDFKSVMPGDSIAQTVTVRNDASNKVKVKIYMRSLGAESGSEDFLSKLQLSVKKSNDNEMAYMFDSTADKTDGLTDWLLLGTLYSGGEVNLDVKLEVPTSLGNEYAEKIGKLTWEFKVEELPIEPSDPKPPQTGDNSSILVYIIFAVSLCATVIFFILLIKRKENKETE